MAYPIDYVKRKIVKGSDKPLNNPIRCVGTNQIGIIPPEYVNITPTFRIRCDECWVEFRPNKTGLLPVHPPGQMKFTFPIKYADYCDNGRHYMKKGTRAKYTGKRLSCVKHI